MYFYVKQKVTHFFLKRVVDPKTECKEGRYKGQTKTGKIRVKWREKEGKEGGGVELQRVLDLVESGPFSSII